jgi:hypothetical protein
MRSIASLAILLAASSIGATEGFDAHFIDATLRLDFHHTGDADREFVAVDRIYRQGRWAGPRTRLIDPFRYGGYLVEVRDADSGALLFSRGFDSYFGEYRTTTDAAEGVLRTFHETVLMPFPKAEITVELTARRRDGTVTEIGSFTIDPGADERIASEPPSAGAVVVISHQGAGIAESLDIAIIGEGYRADEVEAFQRDLKKATQTLLGHRPFAAHSDRVNVRGVLVPSADSGCDEPTRGHYAATTVGATFNSLGSERYLLTEDNRSLRDVAANVPYDALIIMVNHDRYGGGGIYNLYCTFTARSEWADYLLLHELGHSFAGLADEYYSSQVAYNDFYPRDREPVEPNITALLDPLDLGWADLMEPHVPLPTPWEKEAYDLRDGAYQKERTELNQAIAEAARSGASEDALQALRAEEARHAAEHARWTESFLASSQWADVVGAFEGAGYSATVDCLMFSRRLQPYCPVCQRAVDRMISRYTE